MARIVYNKKTKGETKERKRWDTTKIEMKGKLKEIDR